MRTCSLLPDFRELPETNSSLPWNSSQTTISYSEELHSRISMVETKEVAIDYHEGFAGSNRPMPQFMRISFSRR